MISLIFLVCSLNQECQTISPKFLFQNRSDCEAAAKLILEKNKEAEARKELPPHTAEYVCFSWEDKA